MKKKLLITGVSGMLGSNVAYVLRDEYDIIGWYNSNPVFIPGTVSRKVDITDQGSVKRWMADCDPAIVMHCAALTNVDYCEKNKVEARKVNVEATGNIVAVCDNQDTKVVYVSTDSVYDGKKGNYTEGDPIVPCNYYGVTKCEAESVIKSRRNHIVVRTNIFGWNVQNKLSLAEWVVSNLERGCAFDGFMDAMFSSIYTMDFARILEIMLRRDLVGTFNLGSRTSVSKYDFAALIAGAFNKNKDLITPISIDGFAFAAKRGKNLSLNTNKLSRALGAELPSIEECVSAFAKDRERGVADEIKRWSRP